jgi:putative phosphoesterase
MLWTPLHLSDPDAVFHLGDGYKDLRGLGLMYPDIGVYAVGGNCDFHCDMPAFKVADIQGVRIFMTHGHTYKVKNGLHLLTAAARSFDSDIVLFGHTHTEYCEVRQGMTVINPGSIGYSGSYGILTITNGKASYESREL